jgi:hypothetical protein
MIGRRKKLDVIVQEQPNIVRVILRIVFLAAIFSVALSSLIGAFAFFSMHWNKFS